MFYILPGGTDLTQSDPPNTQGFSLLAAPHLGHVDGSLEIRASILHRSGRGNWAWHGYLDSGNVWREA